MVKGKVPAIQWESSFNGVRNEHESFKSQKRIVYEYLQSNVATASMVEEATGVKQKCVTWIKYGLEKEGALWEVKQTRCQITGNFAWYLTTNPDLKPEDIQYDMFE